MLKWLSLEKLEIDKLLAEFLIYKFLMAHLLELLMKHSTPVRFKLKTSPQLKRNSKLIITTWSRATMTLTLLKPTKKNGKSLPQEPTWWTVELTHTHQLRSQLKLLFPSLWSKIMRPINPLSQPSRALERSPLNNKLLKRPRLKTFSTETRTHPNGLMISRTASIFTLRKQERFSPHTIEHLLCRRYNI